MARVEKGYTRQLVVHLIGLGVTKWRIHRELGCSYQNVKAWENGKYEASREHIGKLQQMYNDRCKFLQIGLYSPIRDYPYK